MRFGDGSGSGGGEIVKRIQMLIDEVWGRKRIILKADSEPAIKELRDRIREARKDETITEAPPTYDSKANGLAERAVREIEGLMRTWMAALESKYKSKIPVTHPLTPFLTEYVGELYNRTQKGGPDGMTPYKKAKRQRVDNNIGAIWGKGVL